MLLRQIKYFQTVVEKGSFTEAAEACYISQSAISQQIQSLENEIGVKLFERKKRRFTLTPAGEYFYNKTVVLSSELERICRETVRIAHRDYTQLNIGYLRCYGGDEFQLALADFTAKYSDVNVSVTEGNHEELYDELRFGKVDLVLNDQRRAFSDEYVNFELMRTNCFVEVSTNNPLSKLDRIDIADLKNTPCILVVSKGQEETEQTYYRDVVGFSGDFVFADSLQKARIMVVSNRGVMPIEGARDSGYFGSGIRRVPLYRADKPLTRNYCAFWKEDNSGFYVEEFADMLKKRFERL
ncbi:MAG: LysR family transcriptional regulator [Ruminococcus sp.]|nr:LysR family transcriptional regulator [Ruminococcus sp.]